MKKLGSFFGIVQDTDKYKDLIRLTLPDDSEIMGCKMTLQFDKGQDDFTACYFEFTRKSDRLKAQLSITLSPHKKILDNVAVVSGIAGSQEGYLIESRSISGRPLGQKILRFTTDLSGKMFPSEVIIDGSIFFYLQATLPLLRDAKGNLVKGLDGEWIPQKVSAADWRSLEDKAIKILDRATVLGLTSRPAESAPLWAKEQVAKRRAEQKRQ
jgi:hypothetical protein